MFRRKVTEQKLTENKHRLEDELIARAEGIHSFNHDTDWEQENNPHIKPNKKATSDPRVTNNPAHQKDVRGEGPDHMRDFLLLLIMLYYLHQLIKSEETGECSRTVSLTQLCSSMGALLHLPPLRACGLLFQPHQSPFLSPPIC